MSFTEKENKKRTLNNRRMYNMKIYTCPQCGDEFNKLYGPVDEKDLDLEYENPKYQYFECPECGYRDRKNNFK